MASLVKFMDQLGLQLEWPNCANRPARQSPTVQNPIDRPWLKRYALDARPGLCILISDLMDEQGYADGLNALGSARLDVNLLHTLCPAEIDPQFVGDLKLKDIETAATQDMSMDDVALNQYRERLQTWTAEIECFLPQTRRQISPHRHLAAGRADFIARSARRGVAHLNDV